jgi:drug/metabolite transporter (DMT)-like permease
MESTPQLCQGQELNAGFAGAAPQERSRPGRKQALLSVLAAVALWSTSYVVTKVGVGDIPPLTFGAIRFSFAAALAGLLTLFIRLEPMPLRDIARLALGGLLGITAYFSLQNLGVQRTSASEATLLVASFPAITMLLEVAFLKVRVSPIRFVGVGIAFAGVYLVIRQTAVSAGSHRLEGDLMLLATGLVWALYNFATQKVIQRYSTFTVIFWQTLVGALYLGAFCSIAAFVLYGYGLKSLDPGSAVSVVNLVPVFGLILAVAGLKEEVSFVQVLGGLIVVGGVTLSVQLVPRK